MTTHEKSQAIIYPDSDGQPMADNTLQFEYITTIQGGLDALFRDDPGVFVAGDLLWYPVEGQPTVRMAPDVFVVFGRPKGYRGSYQQWKEGGLPPQVVFEILSPGNRSADPIRRFQFYLAHGVDEYYVYDPDRGDLLGWLRSGVALEEIANMSGWVSPRLKVRFELEDGRLVLLDPAGRRFASYVELWSMVHEQHRGADLESRHAEQERERAEQESQRTEQERQRADQEHQRAERLAARLRALGETPEG